MHDPTTAICVSGKGAPLRMIRRADRAGDTNAVLHFVGEGRAADGSADAHA